MLSSMLRTIPGRSSIFPRHRVPKRIIQGSLNQSLHENHCHQMSSFSLVLQSWPKVESSGMLGKLKPEHFRAYNSLRCRHPGVTVAPTFGNAMEGVRLFCTKREGDKKPARPPGRQCAVDDCTRQANYGPEEDELGTYCKVHKKPEHVFMASKRCRHPGCTVVASFGDIVEGVKLFCLKHKRQGDTNLTLPRCQQPDCSMVASFGAPSDRIKRFCKTHKREEDMILTKRGVDAHQCAEPGCASWATYGPKEDKRGTYCKLHKKPEHLFMASKRCRDPGCTIVASFGDVEERTKMFCDKHKRKGDVNLSNARCQQPGCAVTASFGCPEDRMKRFCRKHQREGDVLLGGRRCSVESCTIIPHFGPPGGRRLFCKYHKRDTDVHVTRHKNKLKKEAEAKKNWVPESPTTHDHSASAPPP